MYFLIEYDRETKKLVQCTEYEDRNRAWKNRFDLEEKLTKAGREYVETVIFEADSRFDLEHNHSRYFKDFKGVFKILEDPNFKRKIKDLSKT